MSGLEKTMRRFLVEEIKDGRAVLKGQEALHLSRVLRYEPGERVLVFDGRGSLYRSRILAIGPEVLVQIEAEIEAEAENRLEITLAQGLLKGDKMDFVVQKATELGAASFVPLTLERSVVKLTDKKAEQRQERWQRIAQEAVKQCGRVTVPDIRPVQSLDDLLLSAEDYDLLLFPWEEEQEMSVKAILNEHLNCHKVLCILGPEGGMTKEEMLAVKKAGGRVVTLGKRILRAETASVAVLSIVQYALGDLG